MQAFIKCTPTYFEDFTNLLNRKFPSVILHELVDFRPLAEKMLTVFFKISRSIFCRPALFSVLPTHAAQESVELPHFH